MSKLSLKDPFLAMSLPVLYVIAESDSGPCKIGIADDLTKRLSSLQTDNPRALYVAHSWRVGAPLLRTLERIIHSRLAKQQLRGEWFDVTPEEAASLIRPRVTYSDRKARAS